MLTRSPASPPRRQRILITGASSGLGAQMARTWAADGRDLALCARRRPELERLRDELLTAHPDRTVVIRTLDVNDPAATEEVFAECSTELGGLDRVVANAGIAAGGPLGRGHAEDNRRVAQTNFVGALNQCEAAMTRFRPVGAGHLVVISSMAALRGMRAEMNVYAATKAGLTNLAEGLRSDLWHTSITVSSIHPGYIRTELLTADTPVRWAVDVQTGTASIVAAIEREPARAYVPARPWAYLAWPMRTLPLGVFRRLAG